MLQTSSFGPASTDIVHGQTTHDASVTQPPWLKQLCALVDRWLSTLPESLAVFPTTVDNTKEPLSRFWSREHALGVHILTTVRHDLSEVIRMSRGERKHTNHLRMLVACLPKGVVPEHWNQYNVPKRYTVSDWMTDFSLRLRQLEQVLQRLGANPTATDAVPTWMGGLFFPTRFVTATRQTVAQRNGQSLEELQLVLDLAGNSGADAFPISGFRLEGGEWKSGKIQLSNDLTTKLDLVFLRWSSTASTDEAKCLALPVYQNSDRKDVLFSAMLPCDLKDHVLVVQRGVALIASC